MNNVFDLEKIKKQKQQEQDNWTYREYIDDLQAIREQFHLLPLEHQHQVFQETSHLLIELIRSAISDGKCE